METPKPIRKACDLCYRKKLKCDSQKPRCSTCVIYDCDCTHKAASRKKGAAKQAAAKKDAGMQATVKSLEEQLQEALGKIERLEKSSSSSSSPEEVQYSMDVQDPTLRRNNDDIVPIEPVRRRSPVHRNVPPYHDALPLIEEYLSTFNSVYPLFDPSTILRTFHFFHTNPNHTNSPVEWALLNVVLALATHTTRCPAPNPHASTYLAAAQSGLSAIVASEDISLMNVQIPLGLAMLFWMVNDVQASMILVATALRLAHRIGLQSKTASLHLPAAEVLQRNRVFWMCYILDRDTSMLARVAPIQQDGDTDIDLPAAELPSNEEDGMGFLFPPSTTSSSRPFNFFLSRIHLARIQGKVHESVYSLSAQSATPSQRANNISHVLAALDEWSANIPAAFHPRNITTSPVDRLLLRPLTILHGTRLGLRALISHASSADSFHYSQWVGDVQEYGKSTLAGEVLSPAPLVSKGWEGMVQESRDFLGLFERVGLQDSFLLTLSSCAYFTGLVCLAANAIFSFTQSSDEGLMDQATWLLEDMAERPGVNYKVPQLRNAVRELRGYASVISSSRCNKTADSWAWEGVMSEDFSFLPSIENGLIIPELDF